MTEPADIGLHRKLADMEARVAALEARLAAQEGELRAEIEDLRLALIETLDGVKRETEVTRQTIRELLTGIRSLRPAS